MVRMTKKYPGFQCRLPQFSNLSWLSPFGLAPLTTCAQVDKSELPQFSDVLRLSPSGLAGLLTN